MVLELPVYGHYKIITCNIFQILFMIKIDLSDNFNRNIKQAPCCPLRSESFRNVFVLLS